MEGAPSRWRVAWGAFAAVALLFCLAARSGTASFQLSSRINRPSPPSSVTFARPAHQGKLALNGDALTRPLARGPPHQRRAPDRAGVRSAAPSLARALQPPSLPPTCPPPLLLLLLLPLLLPAAGALCLCRPQSRPPPALSAAAYSGGDASATDPGSDDRVVVVQRIPYGVTWQSLREHFSRAGKVVYANISFKQVGGARGVVRYARAEDATRALYIMPGQPIDGVHVSVQPDVGQARMRKRPPPEGPVWTLDWRRDPNDHTADGSAADQEFETLVWERIARRNALRQERRYAEADGIREDLRKMGVLIDDRTCVWFVNRDPEGYAFHSERNAAGEAETEPNPTFIQDVQSMLTERQRLRERRDFERADRIRFKLDARGVKVNDATKEWEVAPQGEADPQQVIVWNLPDSATWQTLKDVCRAAGNVEYVAIYRNRETWKPIGRAMVRYTSPEGARRALKVLRRAPLFGVQLDVRPDERPAVRRERPEHVWGPPSAFLRRYLANTGPRPT
eukprot:EG_transcript_8663